MRYLILSFFKLVLGVSSKITLNIVDKNLGISKVFLKEDFEFKIYNWSDAFAAAIILGPFENDNIIKK